MALVLSACGGNDEVLGCAGVCGPAVFGFAGGMTGESIQELDLGTMAAGESQSRFVFVRNEGAKGTKIEVTGVAVNGADGLTLRTDDELPRELPAYSGAMGDLLVVELRAAPELAGTIDARLVVDAVVEGALETYELPIHGEVTGTADLHLSQTHVVLAGAVGQPATGFVTLRNNGTAPVEIQRVDVADEGMVQVAMADAMPATLMPGDQTLMQLTFRSDTPGESRTMVHIVTADGQGRSLLVTGRALAPPQAVVERTTIDIGDVVVGTVLTTAFYVDNTGGSDLHVQAPHLIAPDDSAISTYGPATVVPPNGSTSIMVSFDANSTLGVHEATIVVRTDDPNASKIHVRVRGRVIIN